MSKEQTTKAKALLAKGIRSRDIAKQLAVPLLQIRTLRRKLNQAEHRNLQEDKERLLELSSTFTVQALERLTREVNTMDINRLAISFGIVVDKQLLLQGQATQRIETTRGISQEKLIDVLEQMKRDRLAEQAEKKTIDIESTVERISPSNECHYVNPHPNGYGLTPLR
jgi:hypothetical protein